LTASGAVKYKWYDSFTGGDAIATGSQLNVANIVRDTTLFVSNADESYESIRTAAHVRVQAKPQVLTSRSTILCEGDIVTLSVEEASAYLWSTGATTQSIDVGAAGDYSVDVTFDNGVLNCESSSEVVTVITLSKPIADFSVTIVLPVGNTSFDFVDESTDADTWFWDFGDGTSSEEQNPSHQYEASGNYTVVLTVTHANGCQADTSQYVSAVVSVERDLEKAIRVYPVPAAHDDVIVQFDGVTATHIDMVLMSAQGGQLQERKFDHPASSFSETLNIKSLQSGIYFLRVRVDGTTIVKKVVITR
jgi:PKD repeat protein